MATVAKLLVSSLAALKQVQQNNDFTIISISFPTGTSTKRVAITQIFK